MRSPPHTRLVKCKSTLGQTGMKLGEAMTVVARRGNRARKSGMSCKYPDGWIEIERIVEKWLKQRRRSWLENQSNSSLRMLRYATSVNEQRSARSSCRLGHKDRHLPSDRSMPSRCTYLDNPSFPGGIASCQRWSFISLSMLIDQKRYRRHSSVNRLSTSESDCRARSSSR